MAMRKHAQKSRQAKVSLPIVVEKDEDGYTVECPIFPGCYTQGDTLDEALKNIEEVIAMVLEEKECQEILRNYRPLQISFHTITI